MYVKQRELVELLLEERETLLDGMLHTWDAYHDPLFLCVFEDGI